MSVVHVECARRRQHVCVALVTLGVPNYNSDFSGCTKLAGGIGRAAPCHITGSNKFASVVDTKRQLKSLSDLVFIKNNNFFLLNHKKYR